jgi:hypothetical protein
LTGAANIFILIKLNSMNRRIISTILVLALFVLIGSSVGCNRADVSKKNREERNYLLLSLGLPFLPGPLVQYDVIDPTSPQRGKLLTAQRIWDLPLSYVNQLVRQYLAETNVSLDSYPSLTPLYGMKYYRITYETIDTDNNQIEASGVVWIPNAPGPFPLLAYCHGTEVGTDIEFSRISAGLFAARGYVSVGPDYLGYGASSAIDHPFVHAASLASSTVDAIESAMQFVQYNSISLNYNDPGNTHPELFVTGISEGGMAAMATVRELEAHYAAKYPITAAAPVSGPYDLSTTAGDYIVTGGKDIDTSQAEYLLFVIPVYKEIYSLAQPLSYYLKSPYDAWFTEDPYPRSDYATIADYLPANTNGLLGDAFVSSYTSGGEQDLRDALAENDTWNFTPQSPLTVYAANQDVDVPKANAEKAYTHFHSTAAASYTWAVFVDGTHTSSVVPILANMMIWFEDPASAPPAP